MLDAGSAVLRLSNNYRWPRSLVVKVKIAGGRLSGPPLQFPSASLLWLHGWEPRGR